MGKQKYSLTDLGEPIFTSRSSQIFQLEDGTLLKLFMEKVDPAMIRHEELNTKETFDKKVSMVRCCGSMKVGSRTGIILGRVSGKTLISLVSSQPASAFRLVKLMVELQVKMHNTHTSKIRSYKEMVLAALDSKPLSFLTKQEKKSAIMRISSLPDGDSILHLDYHPDNIMSDGKETTIIDWMTAARGVPAADVAATVFLLSEGEMIPGLPKAVAAILEIVRKMLCRKYSANYMKTTGLTIDEISCWRLPFLIVRLGVWNIESEIPALQQKIRAELAVKQDAHCK